MTGVADAIAQRVISHLREGDIVNLGIGIPTRVAEHLPRHAGIVLHSENGMLGVGPTPASADVDLDLVNAGKLPVSETAGTSYFSSSASFGMIRGGHIDVAVLGALEVDSHGRIANWSIPGQPILGVGVDLDFLVVAQRIIVAMTHTTKEKRPKIVPRCSYPLTGQRSVDVIVTECATFTVEDDGLVLTEVAEGSSLAWIRAHTTAPFRISATAQEDARAGQTRSAIGHIESIETRAADELA